MITKIELNTSSASDNADWEYTITDVNLCYPSTLQEVRDILDDATIDDIQLTSYRNGETRTTLIRNNFITSYVVVEKANDK